MTLTEAIKHCEDVADYDCFTDEQRKCSDEHRQLADWLRDYKRLLDEPEIIRCKDCKYTDGCEPIEDGRYWCCLHESFMYYCSDAERKEDE